MNIRNNEKPDKAKSRPKKSRVDCHVMRSVVCSSDPLSLRFVWRRNRLQSARSESKTRRRVPGTLRTLKARLSRTRKVQACKKSQNGKRRHRIYISHSRRVYLQHACMMRTRNGGSKIRFWRGVITAGGPHSLRVSSSRSQCEAATSVSRSLRWTDGDNDATLRGKKLF